MTRGERLERSARLMKLRRYTPGIIQTILRDHRCKERRALNLPRDPQCRCKSCTRARFERRRQRWTRLTSIELGGPNPYPQSHWKEMIAFAETGVWGRGVRHTQPHRAAA